MAGLVEVDFLPAGGRRKARDWNIGCFFNLLHYLRSYSLNPVSYMGTYQFRLPSSKEVFLFGITGGVVGATLLHMMLMVPELRIQVIPIIPYTAVLLLFLASLKYQTPSMSFRSLLLNAVSMGVIAATIVVGYLVVYFLASETLTGGPVWTYFLEFGSLMVYTIAAGSVISGVLSFNWKTLRRA